MIELCRHIFLDGRFCRGSAVKETFFCRHQNSVRATLTQPRRAATSGIHQLLPFAYPEDRKAILLNLFLVQNALNEGAIDPRRANALTNVMRAQMSNLAKIEKAEAQAQQIQPQAEPEEPRLAAQTAIQQIYQMVLTPEGEEIASPRQAPEEEEIPGPAPSKKPGCRTSESACDTENPAKPENLAGPGIGPSSGAWRENNEIFKMLGYPHEQLRPSSGEEPEKSLADSPPGSWKLAP
ncbi:MAG TPA: hypothetical protein VFW25_09685 [Silvibacterium sp.]|nr:hypothetical protein [Silvibacterium sp.]